MELYVLTEEMCYKLFPKGTSVFNPFRYWPALPAAEQIWYSYPTQLEIYQKVNILYQGKAIWVYSSLTPSPLCGEPPLTEVVFPKLSKPDSWRAILATWRWEIFTWVIDIGGWIESIIDTILDWINGFIEWVEGGATKAIQVWEAFQTLWSDISSFIDRLLAPIRNVIDDIEDWIDERVSDIRDWVSELVKDIEDWIDERVSNIENISGRISEEWDDFWRYTFPNLIDNITFWDYLNIGIIPIIETINTLSDIADSVVEFLNDPIGWIQTNIIEPKITEFKQGFDRGLERKEE